jgi:UPF0755 protein
MNSRFTSKNIRIGFLLILAGLLLIITPFLYYSYSKYSLPEEQNNFFKIPNGSTLKKVSFNLGEAGIIRNPYAFMILVILRGDENNLIAGTYHFEGEVSHHLVAEEIVNGRIAEMRLTIPEGLNFTNIVELLCDTLKFNRQEISGLETDLDLIGALGLGTEKLEGFLFPDTYDIPVDITPEDLFLVLIRRYQEIFDDSLRKGAEKLGMSEVEVVTLASIIEKETRLEKERRTISGVFHRRLKKRMALEADPTVRYALGKYTGRILYKDLEVKSPYNTYKYRGLPPGPICSPGKASILAALYPEEVSYLYFVAAGDGSHIFSDTLLEHNRARRQVRLANKKK